MGIFQSQDLVRIFFGVAETENPECVPRADQQDAQFINPRDQKPMSVDWSLHFAGANLI